jgi:hypothetical protein
MKISLLHPSRGRPKKAYQTAKQWVEKAGVEVEYILSLDEDDDSEIKYLDLFIPHRDWKVISWLNGNVVNATNRAAQSSEGDILVYLSDDFKCPDNWGNLIIKEFEGATGPRMLKVDDCLQKFDIPILTIPIMNRVMYDRLGYFWNPEYKSMFCDEHLYWVAKKLNAIKLCPHLKFPHEHPSNGKAVTDETYQRSAANWNQGKAVFERHKKQGFPV